jgi:hypothetical protein
VRERKQGDGPELPTQGSGDFAQTLLAAGRSLIS